MTKKTAKRTALVTGATGFVGFHLVHRLIKEGWETHIITRPSSTMILLNDVRNKVIVHQHDGSTNSMIKIVESVEPDIVFHLASVFLAQHKPADIESLVQSNLLLGTQLVEAMILQGVTKLINTGTSWQHYENKDYSPVNLYAATKQAFEAILQYYVEAKGLQVITLKLYDTYGPDDARPKLFTLLRDLVEAQVPLGMSPGEQLIDFVYIDDVVEAYLVGAKRLQSSKIRGQEEYAVCSGNWVSLREAVRIYEKITNKVSPIQWGGRPYRVREMIEPWKNGACLSDWRTNVKLEDGIRKIMKAQLPPAACVTKAEHSKKAES